MAIQTHNLKAGYKDKIIINDLSIHIPSGSFCSIIGPNGCGKSTLLKTLSRTLPLLGGSITIGNQYIGDIKTRELARKMAFLSQSPPLPEHSLVKELVYCGRFPHTNWKGTLNTHDHEIVDKAMNLAEIMDYKGREINSLSGGEQQRVWIAMALAQEAEILLLDEPTTHLDVSHQIQTLELIRKLNCEMNRTILMVLHDLNQASQYSDYIFVMNKGELFSKGKPKDIITTQLLREVFQVESKVVHDEDINRPYFIPIRSK